MPQLKSNNFKKKHVIKVPKSIQVTYCTIKNILVFFQLDEKKKKSFKLEVKIFLLSENNLIIVSDIPSKLGSKDVKKLQGTTVAIIKQKLIEMSYTLFTKLILVGVGYRVFPYEKLENRFYLKLGYSHLVYFQIPDDLTVFCHKTTKIFLFGKSSYNILTQTAAQIRSCKIPEIYKGKGILYDQEKVDIKKGKKV